MKVVIWYTQIGLLYCRIFNSYKEADKYLKEHNIKGHRSKVVPDDHYYFEHDGV